jgi:hypothetical protein
MGCVRIRSVWQVLISDENETSLLELGCCGLTGDHCCQINQGCIPQKSREAHHPALPLDGMIGEALNNWRTVPCNTGVYTLSLQEQQKPAPPTLAHNIHDVALHRSWSFLPNYVRQRIFSLWNSKLTILRAALDETARKSRKAKNKFGNPIKLPSKILAIAADPHDAGAVYVAEAAGTVKKIALEVCKMVYSIW